MGPIETASTLTRQFEGLRLKAYLCPAGVPTLGYGSTGPDIKLGMTCSREWAEQRMLMDLAAYWARVRNTSPILLTQSGERGGAVLDWAYNLGTARYASSTFRRRVDAQRWVDAANELRKWVYAGGKKLRGLELRREEEVKYFLLMADMVELG